MKISLIVIMLFGFGFISKSQCDDFVMTISHNDPTCYNFSDGSIAIIVSGGNGGNSFTITNSAGTPINSFPGTNNLLGGWYYCHVIDINGCELYDSVFLVNPAQMVAQMTFTNPSSVGLCDGIAEVDTVLNYQGSYANITYYWTPGGPSGIGQNIKSDLCDDYYTLHINDAWGCSIVVDLTIGSASIGDNVLTGNIVLYPNPTISNVIVEFELINKSAIEIDLIDLNGKSVKSPITNEQAFGQQKFAFDLTEVSNGIYFIRLRINDEYYFEKIVKE